MLNVCSVYEIPYKTTFLGYYVNQDGVVTQLAANACKNISSTLLQCTPTKASYGSVRWGFNATITGTSTPLQVITGDLRQDFVA